MLQRRLGDVQQERQAAGAAEGIADRTDRRVQLDAPHRFLLQPGQADLDATGSAERACEPDTFRMAAAADTAAACSEDLLVEEAAGHGLERAPIQQLRKSHDAVRFAAYLLRRRLAEQHLQAHRVFAFLFPGLQAGIHLAGARLQAPVHYPIPHKFGNPLPYGQERSFSVEKSELCRFPYSSSDGE